MQKPPAVGFAILTGGEIGALNQLKHINIQYDYQYMAVGDFNTEAEYLVFVLKEKGERKGEKFIEEWKNSRQQFEPSFELNFADQMKKVGITVRNDTSTTGVTLLVRITKIEPKYPYELTINLINDYRNQPHILLSCTLFDAENFLVSFNVSAYSSKGFTVFSHLLDCYGLAGNAFGKRIVNDLETFKDTGKGTK